MERVGDSSPISYAALTAAATGALVGAGEDARVYDGFEDGGVSFEVGGSFMMLFVLDFYVQDGRC